MVLDVSGWCGSGRFWILGFWMVHNAVVLDGVVLDEVDAVVLDGT